ncbi:MAG TPA: hypothetical protein PLJ23_03035 [Gemmatimonadales bacterium]|jgi:hypothetical protein|nr:hypothetical protein [Gemmatimonadales bacterium]
MSGRFSRGLAMVLVLGLTGIAALMLAFMMSEGRRNGFEFVIAGMFGGGALGWLLLRGPVGKALADMLVGAGASDPMVAQRLADLEARLADVEHRGLTSGEVDQAYARLAEMEERLEFTERMLAQPRLGEGRNGS